MWIIVKLKERDSTAMFDTDNISRIDMTGDACGISLKGHVAQLRITMDYFSRFKHHFKAQVLSDMPCPVRHKES